MEKKAISDIINQIKSMTIVEINELISAIETEFKVSANINLQASDQGNKKASDDAEASEVTVWLKEVGPKKVEMIKKVRELKNLGLMEAKKLVDQTPVVIEEKTKPDKAKELKKILEDIGGVVELK
ncbi:50S ribosomal protein L7/L12 [Mycoplasma sp. SG1]|uniref:50S ribosomal protein L7/L12 n=1 Tax=Mycoplasma sp. SG1 TaxID=2810348 RepID=UPI002024B025|nr:50S ribosomal protein L7/L12 [Mycoplasma sp. SG1]URM52882.1 50S ribosomal protein L7/L12 [Mycoplasma sp. SG1]